MLYILNSTTDEYFNFLKQDPVRPNIPTEVRIGKNKDVFVHKDDAGDINAITCVSYQNLVPKTDKELFNENDEPSIAIFYTIWSYKPGKGRQLILDSVQYINEHKPNIQRFVTLSPKTEMAKRFHLNNGALVLQENDETVNYEYIRNGTRNNIW